MDFEKLNFQEFPSLGEDAPSSTRLELRPQTVKWGEKQHKPPSSVIGKESYLCSFSVVSRTINFLFTVPCYSDFQSNMMTLVDARVLHTNIPTQIPSLQNCV